jgi:hypothetical protein
MLVRHIDLPQQVVGLCIHLLQSLLTKVNFALLHMVIIILIVQKRLPLATQNAGMQKENQL